jgi:UDP-GlcNAc:undecaprenyl-phosphate GlcNAc-1-phosphate transferase
MSFLAALIISLVVALLIIPLVTRFAARLRLVDTPDLRKLHGVAIPRVGGIGMVIGTMFALLLLNLQDQNLPAIMAAVGILFLFCVADDRGDLDYRLKFLGQIIAVLVVVVFGHVRIEIVPFMGLDPVSGWISIPLTMVALVGITNAINLSDGLDGLASGMVMLSLAGIGLLAHLAEGVELLVMVLAVTGAIMGFLRFNTYPANIFMGDTGSQFLGFFTGVLAIMLTQQVNTALNPAIPLLLLGIPIFDTAFVMIKRIYKKKSPFVADRNHIHHQLLALNFDHYEAVIVIYLAQAMLVATGVLLRYQSDVLVVMSWLLMNIFFAAAMVGAGRSGWRAHNPDYQSFLARIMQSLRRSRFMKTAPLIILSAAVALLFLAGPFLTGKVSSDIGYLALGLAVAMIVRIILGRRYWFLSLRLLLYVAVAAILFQTGKYPSPGFTVPLVLDHAYYGVVMVFLVIGARYAVDDAFKITPTDILILLFMVGLALAQRAEVLDDLMSGIVIRMVIMFFAIEYVLKGMNTRVYAVTVPALLAMSGLAFRGIFTV